MGFGRFVELAVDGCLRVVEFFPGVFRQAALFLVLFFDRHRRSWGVGGGGSCAEGRRGVFRVNALRCLAFFSLLAIPWLLSAGGGHRRR